MLEGGSIPPMPVCCGRESAGFNRSLLLTLASASKASYASSAGTPSLTCTVKAWVRRCWPTFRGPSSDKKSMGREISETHLQKVFVWTGFTSKKPSCILADDVRAISDLYLLVAQSSKAAKGLRAIDARTWTANHSNQYAESLLLVESERRERRYESPLLSVSLLK